MLIRQVARGLAMAFLAGDWTPRGLATRGRQALGERPPWLVPMVRRLLAEFPAPPLDRTEDFEEWVYVDPGLRDAIWPSPPRQPRQPRIVRWLVGEPAMVPVTGPPAGFAVFPLASHAELARHLGVSSRMLAWHADLLGINARSADEPIWHYRYRWVAKMRGGYRLLEAPKPRLKQIQRWVLDHLLAPIPVAAEAHGFVRGRNVRSFALPHVGRAVVVRLDLADFFGSIRRSRVTAIFARLGYPRPMARTLAGLCTAATPDRVLREHPRAGDQHQRFITNAHLRDPHLPQGSPTSPALANLAAWRLDRRLSALAAGFGAVMTRYADDLAFAGDRPFATSLPFFLPRAAAIALEEGFQVNHRKTRVMHRGRRQQLCGVVVNDGVNPPRRETDTLRALLFNAARLGPETQNRERHPDFRAHLLGRIAWVSSLNPTRGARLRAIFDRIHWG